MTEPKKQSVYPCKNFEYCNVRRFSMFSCKTERFILSCQTYKNYEENNVENQLGIGGMTVPPKGLVKKCDNQPGGNREG